MTIEEERRQQRAIVAAKRDRLINTFRIKLKDVDWRRCELWLRGVNDRDEIQFTLISSDSDYCFSVLEYIKQVYTGMIEEELGAQIGKDGDDTFIYFKFRSVT